MLTGDTLFIGDVGRPDLRGALGWSAERARRACSTTRCTSKLAPLPDDTLVYPAHGAGSLCGKNLSSETVSTIGDAARVQLRAAADEPRAVHRDRDQPISRTRRPTSPTTRCSTRASARRSTQALERELTPLSLERGARARRRPGRSCSTRAIRRVRRRAPDGQPQHRPRRQLRHLVRDAARSASGRSCWSPSPGARSRRRCGSGGSASTPSPATSTAGCRRWTPTPGSGRPDRADHRRRRSPSGWPRRSAAAARRARARRVGASSTSTARSTCRSSRLPERMATLPRDRAIVVYCASGYRSAIAASLLRRDGYARRRDLVGGSPAWEAGGRAGRAVATG